MKLSKRPELINGDSGFGGEVGAVVDVEGRKVVAHLAILQLKASSCGIVEEDTTCGGLWRP